MSNHAVAGARLRRQLELSAEAAGCTIDWINARDVRSDTSCFYGGRHSMTLLIGGTACAPWVASLDHDVVCIPGHVLIEIEVTGAEDQGEQLLVEIEAMTVREA